MLCIHHLQSHWPASLSGHLDRSANTDQALIKNLAGSDEIWTIRVSLLLVTNESYERQPRVEKDRKLSRFDKCGPDYFLVTQKKRILKRFLLNSIGTSTSAANLPLYKRTFSIANIKFSNDNVCIPASKTDNSRLKYRIQTQNAQGTNVAILRAASRKTIDLSGDDEI